MIPELKTADYELIERRQYSASKETLFKAWTDPEALKSWFGPEGFTTETAEVDLCIGGAYSLGMRPPEGELLHHRGEYREISPYDRLSFTWILEGQDCDGCTGEHAETLVTLDFVAYGDITEIVLHHTMLPSEEARDNHIGGWIGCFDALQESFQTEK